MNDLNKDRIPFITQRFDVVEIQPTEGKTTILIGGNQEIVLDKEFGPLIFSDLRIKADLESGDWIIERMWIKNGNYIEWCRIPGQYEEEFTDNT